MEQNTAAGQGFLFQFPFNRLRPKKNGAKKKLLTRKKYWFFSTSLKNQPDGCPAGDGGQGAPSGATSRRVVRRRGTPAAQGILASSRLRTAFSQQSFNRHKKYMN